jgi:hypothetical protein
LLDDEKLYYGFALDNCHEIEPLKTPKKTVKDFDKKLHSAKEKQQFQPHYKLLWCIFVNELGLWFYQLTGIDIANYQITFACQSPMGGIN